MSPAIECPRCAGTGFELKTGDRGVLSSKPCECAKGDEGNRRLDAARIPGRYAHCTFEEFKAQDKYLKKAYDVARDWADRWPLVDTGLLLMGAPGTGKTHLAVAIARELVKKGAQVLFQEQRELLKALQASFDSRSQERESQILGRVQRVEVLVLDDLGAGRTTLWAKDVMHDIIAHRYNEKKLMIITTNHELGEGDTPRVKDRDLEAPLNLSDRLGEALMSRIYEMCDTVDIRTKTDFRRIIMHAGDREISRRARLRPEPYGDD